MINEEVPIPPPIDQGATSGTRLVREILGTSQTCSREEAE